MVCWPCVLYKGIKNNPSFVQEDQEVARQTRKAGWLPACLVPPRLADKAASLLALLSLELVVSRISLLA